MAKLAPEEKLKRLRKDIVVKLSKVFENGIISNTGYVFRVSESPKDELREMAIMKADWVNVLFPQFSEPDERPVVFARIPSMDELKKAIDERRSEPVEFIRKDPSGKYSDELCQSLIMMDVYDRQWVRDPRIKWVPMKLSDKDRELLYDESMAVNYPGIQECEGHSITIGKNLFPFTNKDSINSVCMISMLELSRNVYSMLVQTDTQYFVLYERYIFI